MVILFSILSFLLLILLTTAIMWYYWLPKPKEIEMPLIQKEEVMVQKVEMAPARVEHSPLRSPSRYESILSQTRRGTYQAPRENVVIQTTVPTFIDEPQYYDREDREVRTAISPLRSVSPGRRVTYSEALPNLVNHNRSR